MYGAVDIGTNAMRLFFGEVKKGSIYKHAMVRIPLRLGSAIYQYGRITPEKHDMMKYALLGFGNLCQALGVSHTVVCATSAMRESTNGSESTKQLLAETGFEIRTLTGIEEAQLTHQYLFDVYKDKLNDLVIFNDIGGGSTELVAYEHGRRIATQSFKLGSVRALFNKIDSNQWLQLEQWCTAYASGFQVVATGGTVNALVALIGSNHCLGHAAVATLHDTIQGLSAAQILKRWPVREDRADVLVHALGILRKLYEHLHVDNMWVPQTGLVDGLVWDLHRRVSGCI